MTAQLHAPSVSLEVERTYSVPLSLGLPDLERVPGVASVGPPRTLDLDATYWDTADLRLASRGIRLRRRTGGSDAGWHVKIPTAAGTTEIRGPLGQAGTVPEELAAFVRAASRGASLGQVVRLRTRRTERDLLGAGGQVLATVADDDVSGQSLGEQAVLQRWREVEVELAGGAEDVLDAVQRVLLDAGATVSTSPSKLGQMLGSRVLPVWPPLPTRPRKRAPAGVVIAAYLREQVDALVEHDPLVRRDEEDAVHKMRVATRRLRSALRTFRPMLDTQRSEPVRTELAWLAGLLGEVRDREVLLRRFTSAVDALPAELVLGPVSARLEAVLGGEIARARQVLLETLDGERYLSLLETLHDFASAPPFTSADGPAARVLPRHARKAYRRVTRFLDASEQHTDRDRRDIELHEARKSAKRLRYAGESLAPALGKDATRLAERAEDVQELLGEHQDSVVARASLRQLALAAQDAGESAFTFGLLAGMERARAEGVLDDLGPVRKRLSSRKARRLIR